MRNIFKVILRSISTEFYKDHIIPFFILGYLCFGFLEIKDHISIAEGLLDERLMIEYYPIWIAYIAYIAYYTIHKIRRPLNQFLLNISLLNFYEKAATLLILQIVLMLPILVYGIFNVIIAVQINSFINVICISIFFILAMILNCLIVNQKICNPFKEFNNFSVTASYIKITKPSWSFFLIYLMKEKSYMLLITKILSAVILIGFMQIFNVETPDARPLLISVLMMAWIHTTILFENFNFETIQMQNFNQLPVSVEKKFLKNLFVLSLLLLPEMLILLRFAPFQYSFQTKIIVLLFAVSLIIAAYSRLYVVQNQNKFNMELAKAFAIIFFTILFHGGLFVMAGCPVLAFIWFKNNFYKYQPNIEQ